MIILISSKIGKADIKASLGKPEYSYYFLMREFIPALEQLGRVIEASDEVEVEALFDQYLAAGESVVFLSFTPPHQTPVGLRCPTYCVFAWEFDSIPDEPWDNEPRNDWRYVFARLAGAIVLSQEAATAVSQAMGDDYPIIALPAPLWDRHADLSPEGGLSPILDTRQLSFTGQVIDSPLLGLSADGLLGPVKSASALDAPEEAQGASTTAEPMVQALTGWPLKWATTRALAQGWWKEAVEPFMSLPPVPETETLLPTPEPVEVISSVVQYHELELSGVVYTCVLNPHDGRKNWIELISAFCWAFKNEERATLIVKMVHCDPESYRINIMTHLSRLSPFKGRVLVINSYLEPHEYQNLLEVSTYYVNSSACEGLCLPLLEYLCSGKPAISPRHTAMLDYVTADMAVLVQSSIEPAAFLHDPTNQLRTRRYRQSWESLVLAYETSYRIATSEPEHYRSLSSAARSGLHNYCSVARVSQALKVFLTKHDRANPGCPV